MGDLSVTLRFNGVVVESRVLPVHRLVRIGEARDAAIAFPGADVHVVRVGDRLSVRGHPLEEGEAIHLGLGAVDVEVEHAPRRHFSGDWRSQVDMRFVVAAAVLTVMGTWIDTAQLWLDRHPDGPPMVSDVRQALLDVRDAGTRRQAAAVTPAPEAGPPPVAVHELADGPRHLPDDQVTRMGFYLWYRRAVPNDLRVGDMEARLQADPNDATARRVLAQAAYDADDFDTAAWYYQWLVQHDPKDLHARLHLAWAERRRGHLHAEIEQYRAILAQQPNDPLALGGMAVALARLNRLDEATEVLHELEAYEPTAPTTDMDIGLVEAMQGHDREALEAIDRAIAGRAQLSEELQLEFRRDLAIDPALASLRKDKRLRALLHRHLGAAAPQPLR